MLSFKSRKQWPLIILLGLIVIAWRWLWGFCWSPLNTACFEGHGGGDHIQHFYGWLAYARGNPISLAPPMFSNWTWPTAAPLLYSDPIPLAAIILRPIYQIFLVKFQYFSFLSLINMVISALCGYLLGCRVVGSRSSGCTLGVMLAIAPPAILRLSGHEALSLHSLLVIPITLLILRISTLWIWAMLMFMALGIHAYYLPMLLPFVIVRIVSKDMRPTVLFSRWASQLLPQHNVQTAISASLLARLFDAGCILLACLLGVFLFGYAAGGMDVAPKGDQWSANIIAFFDSQGHSAIFSPLKKIEPFQWEGFSYLGIIITILVSLSLYRLLQRKPRPGVRSVATLFPSPRIYWTLVILALIYSFGLNIYLGEQKVLSLQNFAEKVNLDSIYTTFRSSGRFTWPAYYSLLIWGFCSVARFKMNRNAFAAIVFICLLETHIFTLAQVKANLAQRYRAGVDWQQRAGLNKLQQELAAHLATSDLFYNATGDPWFRSNEIPSFFPQAVSPAIHTNYSPYLARLPKQFIQISSRDKCLMAANAIQLASAQGLQRPLLLMNNQTVRNCKRLDFKPVMSLDADISIFSAKHLGPD